MKVKDVMTRNVTTVRENSTIKEAANHMRDLNVGSVPVCDSNNRLIGIVTDRDIVIKNVCEGRDTNTTVNNVMTSNALSVSSDTDIHEASSIMSKYQIRRLPVVDNNTVVGIVSIGDLAVRDIYVDDAGNALSSISEPSRPMR